MVIDRLRGCENRLAGSLLRLHVAAQFLVAADGNRILIGSGAADLRESGAASEKRADIGVQNPAQEGGLRCAGIVGCIPQRLVPAAVREVKRRPQRGIGKRHARRGHVAPEPGPEFRTKGLLIWAQKPMG